MKKKYIVGDLVRYTSLCKEPVAEICEVCETSYLIRFMNGHFARVTNEEIKPLPLTTKILEKNGWKKDSKWYYLKTRRAYLYTIQDAGQPDEFLICANTDKHNLTSVSFVHQLQHLLFGLGLNSEMEV